MNLQKKLNNWESHGIITGYQKERIKDFEKAKTGPNLFYGLLTLAVFCMGLGVVSIVASNWDKIAPSIKLGTAFAMLSACAWAVLESFRRGKEKCFEVFLILFELLLLASIGLIGQIYQQSPDSFPALLLWSVLSLPLWIMARFRILPLIGLPLMGYALINYVYDHETLWLWWQKAETSWTASVPLLLFFTVALVWTCLVRFDKESALRRALSFWLFLGAGLMIYLFDRDYNLDLSNLFEETGFWAYDRLFVLLFTTATLEVLLATYLAKRWHLSYFLPALLILMLIGSLVHLPVVLSIIALFVLALEGYQKENTKYIQTALILMALRLFLFYCQIFNSLWQTGLGFIAGGVLLLVFILTSGLFSRNKEKKNEK